MSHLLLNIAHDCLRNRDPRMDYWDVKKSGPYGEKMPSISIFGLFAGMVRSLFARPE